MNWVDAIILLLILVSGYLGLRWGSLLAVFAGAVLLGIVRWPGRR